MTTMKNGLYLRGRIWWIQFRAGGATVRESTGCTRKEDAKAMLDEKRTAGRKGQVIVGAGKITLADLFAFLLADRRAKHKEPPPLTRLCEFFDVVETKADDGASSFTGGWKAQAVDYDVLTRYVTDRQKACASDSTIHNELAALRRAFRLGRQAKKVTVVPEFPMPEVQNVRESYFTVAQFDRLVTLLPDYLRTAAQFAVLTGIRAENVFALTWPYVDFGRGLVRLPFGRTKTGEPLVIPFDHGSALEKLLRAQEHVKRGEFVFHRNGERIKSYHAAWRTAVKKLGDDGYGEQYDPRTGTTKQVLKRFHDLRHTFAQMMTDAGVPESEILSTGGWKTRAMLDRYRISSQEAKRKAAAQRDRHVEAERQKATQVLGFKKAATA